MKKILFIILVLVVLGVMPARGEAAVLYFSPAEETFYKNDIFVVELGLDTQDDEINAVELDLKIPTDFLEFVELGKGDSILTFWASEPFYNQSQNSLYFIGGIPGGFKGNGKLLTLALRAKTEGQAQLFFQDNSKVLLNDGQGTLANLGKETANFTILAQSREVPKNEWQEILKGDPLPPLSFEIKIGKDASVFEGKYFIAFSAEDFGSGIERYEIKEGAGDWKAGKSPYLLEDQSLSGKILVKAIDKAGNERIEEIMPARKLSSYWIVLVILGLLIVGWLIIRFLRPKSKLVIRI